MYVFASVGISLPHSSGAQTHVGTAIADLSQARPGDIIASNGHTGIYVGNGMVVNALNPRAGTTYTSIPVAFPNGYTIRRVL
jgi:cell wall-associated NlpC family hydrolase